MSEGQPGQALGPQGVSNSRHVPCLGPQRVTWMDLGPLAGCRTVDVVGICHLDKFLYFLLIYLVCFYHVP